MVLVQINRSIISSSAKAWQMAQGQRWSRFKSECECAQEVRLRHAGIVYVDVLRYTYTPCYLDKLPIGRRARTSSQLQ